MGVVDDLQLQSPVFVEGCIEMYRTSGWFRVVADAVE